MISWIQRYFQHHFRTIFAVLLAVIIVTFIFGINASGGFGRADRAMIDRPFFGLNLALQADQQTLMGDAGFSANLRVGAFGQLDGEQIQNYAFQRIATLHLADRWHIPAASPAEITEQIKTLRMFAGPDGQFDPKSYQTFRDNLKTNPRGVNEADIVRIIGDDVRAEKVQNLLSGPGYVLTADIKSQLLRSDTEWTLATATTEYTAFKPEIKPSDADLTQFFEQSGGRYDIPPQVVVSYVDFPALNYISTVNVTEAAVRAFYDGNPSRFPKPADPAKPVKPEVAPVADPAADYAAVRPQVESTLKLEQAQKLAVKAASDFSFSLFESKAKSTESIEAFILSQKQVAKKVAAFARNSPPAEFGGSPEIATEAFRLGKDRLTSDALSTPMGAVILVWRETQATHKPLFTEVRAKISSDFIENERRKRFVELGKTLRTQLEARLKAGDNLEKAAETAGTAQGLKLEVKAIPAFTARARPQDLDYSVFGTLERLEKGQISDMVLSAEKGLFVYAAEKKAPDTTEANPRYAETRTQLASYGSRLGASAYLSDLVEKELKRSEPKGL